MPGILWGSDYETLTQSIARTIGRFHGGVDRLHFVEVGTNEGHTSTALIDCIHKILNAMQSTREFAYCGVDPFVEPKVPYPEFHHVRELSVAAELPPEIHWVFVDGCHCAQCAAGDAIRFGARLALGGEICFHDASPSTQGLDPQTYGGLDAAHHDPAEAARGIRVRLALDDTMPRMRSFRLVRPSPDQPRGGVEVYEKVAP